MCLHIHLQTPPFMLSAELPEHKILKDQSYKAMQNHMLICTHEFSTTYGSCFFSSLCQDCLHLAG